MTKAALKRRINRAYADKHHAKRRLLKQNPPAQVADRLPTCEALLPDDEGFILNLSKREKHVLRTAESEHPPVQSVDLLVPSEWDPTPESTEQERLSDDDFGTQSTVSKSWVRKQLKGPHQGGISKPGCKKRHTTLMRRALLRTRLQLQASTEVSANNCLSNNQSPNNRSTSSTSLDPFQFIQQWATRSVVDSNADATKSTSRKRKKRGKSKTNCENSAADKLHPGRPLAPYKSRSTATHHAIESFRNLLVKF